MSKNNKYNFRIINMNKNSNVPTFNISSNKNWVNYGQKNDYPQVLLSTFHNRSNKHKAIINRKAKMVSGNGFEEIENPEYKFFINNLSSSENKNLNEIVSKVSYDLEIYGGFCLKVRWSNDRSKIASIDYIPYEKVRLSTNENKLLISADWRNYRKNENTPVEVSKFSILDKETDPVQFYYFVEEQPGLEYYPIPSYSSTLTWIEADWEISNFHLSSIQNGFSAGFILNFATGVPTSEEMDMAYKEFQKKYTGSDNAGKFILTFSDGVDNKPELLPLELNASDERFINLSNQIKEEIFIGHEVISPMLFGVRTQGQLGGRDELKDAMELFQSTYIDYQQKKIEGVFNKLGKINGLESELKLKQYEIFKEKDITTGTTPPPLDKKIIK